MKLQELLQRPKPSPSPMPRAGRGADAGEKSGFAEALSEARRKPEPKRAEAEAPARKKPAAAKKKDNAQAEDAARVDDTVTPDEAAVGEAESQPLQGENEPVAMDGEAGDVVEDSGEDPAQDDHEANMEAAALALAAPVPTPPPVTLTPEEEVDAAAAAGLPRATYAGPKGPSQVAEPKQNVVEADVPAGDAADAVTASEQAAPVILEGFESVEDPPLAAEADAGAPLVASAPVAQVNQQGAAPTPVEAAAPSGEPKEERSGQENGSNAPAEWALEPEVLPGEEAAAAPVATTSGDASSAPQLASVHAQAETAKPQATHAGPAAPAPAPVPAQVHFADTNHPKIVTAVQAQALTNGGSMQIRLDPPELGALQVLVHMQDGVMTASFQTSNDDATRMLSHSLSQLKQVLEASGVSVDKLQVQQAPKDQQAGNGGEDHQHQRDQHDDAHRQEQQRKDMLRRMWRRLANGSDPLDLVA